MHLDSEGRLPPIMPFLKWAGGKRWLTLSRPDVFPSSFGRYVEPFLGGGAVFFSLQPRNAIIADVNEELIETYQALVSEWREVVRGLEKHQAAHSDDYYYAVRSSVPKTRATRAARFIYLNRTCWNGLYRVNLRGEFNVPRGTKSTVLFGTDDFGGIAKCLSRAKVRCNDFGKTIGLSREGDFMFVDPPYTVKHNHNGFVKYNERVFSWRDQLRLRDSIARAAERGVKVLVLNARHESVMNLYAGLGAFEAIERNSVLAANPLHRACVEELAIKINY